MSRNYPHWIRAYVEHAQHSEAPLIFHVWSAVSTIAGALRRNVWIDEVEYRYYPNFYIVIVGPAAITKSTAIKRALKFLRQVDGIHFGPQSATWQMFIKKMSESEQDISVVLPDGTIKGMTTCPVTIVASELGTFFKIEDDVMMDVLTDLWESPDGPWIHSTLSMGDNMVNNPCVNLIGATTPTWLKKHFPEELIGAGLTSRIVFVYGEEKAQLVPYPSRLVKPESYLIEERKLVEDLKSIARLQGQYILTPEAYTWGTAWYEEQNRSRPVHLASERFSGYLGRKQVHMHKLAIILAAAKRDKLIIEREDLEEALAMIEMIEPMMLKVFESIGFVDEARRSQEIVQLVRVHGVMTSEQIWRQVYNIMSKKEFEASLTAAVQASRLKVVIHKGMRAVIINPEKEAANG